MTKILGNAVPYCQFKNNKILINKQTKVTEKKQERKINRRVTMTGIKRRTEFDFCFFFLHLSFHRAMIRRRSCWSCKTISWRKKIVRRCNDRFCRRCCWRGAFFIFPSSSFWKVLLLSLLLKTIGFLFFFLAATRSCLFHFSCSLLCLHLSSKTPPVLPRTLRLLPRKQKNHGHAELPTGPYGAGKEWFWLSFLAGLKLMRSFRPNLILL